jgi:hypothetical protein
MKKIIFFFAAVTAIVLCQPVKITAQNSTFIKTGNQENISPAGNSNLTENSQIKTDTKPDSIKRIVDEFPVNTGAGEYGASQYNIRCASDTAGNVGVVWVDERNGAQNIYAQFYNNKGEKYGNNININVYNNCGECYPVIASNKKGNFVILWVDSYNTLRAQRFWANGDRAGNIFFITENCISDPAGISAAVSEDGSFIVAWANGNYDRIVYERVYNAQDVPGNLVALNGPGYSLYNGLHAAAGSDSSYAIVWSAKTSDSGTQIYMQLIDYYGNPEGNSTIVNDSQNTTNDFPLITSTDNGYYFLVWWGYNYSSNESKMKCRIYNVNMGFTSMPFSLNSTSAPQTIGSDWKKYCIIGAKDETYRIIDTSGAMAAYTGQPNTGSGSAETYTYSAVSNITNNSFRKASLGSKYFSTDVYIQKYNSQIVPVESIVKVNDDSVSASQKNPLVYQNNKGMSIVLWEDGRNGRVDLYGRIYDENYNPVGNEFQINPAVNHQWTVKSKAVTSRQDGTFVVGYLGYGENYTGDIYMQCITVDGKLTNPIYVANDEGLGCTIKMNCSSEDELVISWYNYYRVFIEKYDKTLNSIIYKKNLAAVSNFRLNAISIDDKLNILYVWGSYYSDSDGGRMLYGIIYNSDGEPVSDSIIIVKDKNYYQSIDCALDGKDYAVMWYDYGMNIRRGSLADGNYWNYDYKLSNNTGTILQFRNKKLLFGYLTYSSVNFLYFDDNRERMKEFQIPNNNYYSCYSQAELNNSFSLYKNKIFHVYEKIENTTGFNIAGSVLQINNINLSDKSVYKMVNDDYLYNNYPNPFNSKTIIPYKLLTPQRVKLVLYNILGQEIKVLVDEFQEKGFYEVELDASELASGVYIYKLDAFKTFIKKLIVLK